MRLFCLAAALVFLFSGAALSEDHVSFVDLSDAERVVCHVTVDDSADDITVRFNVNAENVKISVCPAFSEERVYTQARVSAGDAVSVRVYIPDAMPNLSLSYTPEGGERTSVWISQSGEDGSLIFIDADRADTAEWLESAARELANEVLANAKDTEYLRQVLGDARLGDIMASVANVAPVDENSEAVVLFTDDPAFMLNALQIPESAAERVRTRPASIAQTMLVSAGGADFTTAANATASEKCFSEPTGFSECLAYFTGEGDACVLVSFERAGDGIVRARAMFAPQPF